MEYEILKVYNNNVVLAKQDQEEVILLSKGIGFGKKQGHKIVDDDNIEKIFYETPLDTDNLDLYHLKKRKEEIENVIRQIICIAEARIGRLNENTEKALIEHIDFAIARLNMGLIIENPFINEIISLYPREYEIAEMVAKLIKESLKIDIGEEEKGFITLHLYSAKTNKTVKETMKVTRLYKGCITIIEREYGFKIDLRRSHSKDFFRSLETFMKAEYSHKKLSMPMKQYIPIIMKESHGVALKITSYIKNETNISFSHDIVGFLALEIEKFIQLL